jgi:hypothetical protein
MGWGFVWLMFFLKIPMIGLFLIVRYAIQPPVEDAPQEPARITPHPHRRPPRSRHGRRPRGPHGGTAALPAPQRVRPAWQTAARGRPLRDL